MSEGIQVLHTANAGVLLQAGGYSLGVDLFSRDPDGLYPDTPAVLREELLDRIEKGTLTQLLFTHAHGDHFCRADVEEAMRRNPELHLISTEEVFRELRRRGVLGTGASYEVSPRRSSNVRLDIVGFSLELFNSPHMGEQYADVQNLVCLIRARDKRILITGDAAPSPELFARVGRWSKEVDLMIVPFPVIGLPSSRRLISRELHVRQILAVHLPRPEKDSQDWVASAKKVCAQAQDGLPMPVFGERVGESYTFI